MHIHLYRHITNVRVSQALTKNANLFWIITRALKASPQMGTPKSPVLAQQRGDRVALLEEEEKVGRGRGSPWAWSSISGLPPPPLSAPGGHKFPARFFKFLSQRGCQGRGIVKSSLPCHKCTRSSRAGGQKLFAISSGHDLCFDHGGGGLQSIKPLPGPHPGRGRGLPLASGGGILVQGAQGHPFAPQVWSRGGGTPSCSLSWRFKLPDGGFSEGNHRVCHTICSCQRDLREFALIFFPKRDAGLRFATSAEWGKMSCRACAYGQPWRAAGCIRTVLLAGAWTKWEMPGDLPPPNPRPLMLPDISRLHRLFEDPTPLCFVRKISSKLEPSPGKQLP